MKKKVAFCTYDAPFFHGPNTWLKRLLADLSKKDFVIQVLIFYEGDLNECDTYGYFNGLGLRVYTFPFRSITEEKIIWILNTLAVDPPDIFVPNMLVGALFAARWIKNAGISTIGVMHSDDEFYDAVTNVFVNGKKEYKLSAFVTCSEFLFKKVKATNPTNIIIETITYGVPIENIPATSFDDNKLVLIYVGRLVDKQKRITDVVKAFCKACNYINGVEAVIYGSGNTSKVLSLINRYDDKKKVTYAGSVDNKEIFDVLSAAHVFVLLSDYEGLPQSLLEAMACGLVPVCFKMNSGIPELVENNKTGILVLDRTHDFIEVIKKLKNDKNLFNKLSKNARQKVFNFYSSDACTEKWNNLLNELYHSNCNPIKKIDIPDKIELPERHPQLSAEDFRIPTPFDLLLEKIRKTKAFRYFKKNILNREA
jgi:colanic acid/amylovoran biosynthesis glycosyltransferase